MILVTQPATVEAKGEDTFEYKPGARIFRPKRYIVPSHIAHDFQVLAITAIINGESYELLVGDGVAPATMFCDGPELHFPNKLLHEDDKIIVKIRNTSAYDQIFNACFLGEP